MGKEHAASDSNNHRNGAGGFLGKVSIWWWIGLILVVFGLWGGAEWWVPLIYPGVDLAVKPGSTFSGIEALFTGLAFAGLILSILYQRKELEAQREELRLQRNELNRQAQAHEQSEEALRKQVRMLALTAFINAGGFLEKHERRQEKRREAMKEAYEELRTLLYPANGKEGDNY